MGRVQGAALSHVGLGCAHYPHDSSVVFKVLATASLWPLVALAYAGAKARHTPRLGSAPALLLTEGVARVLKHAVKQPRPEAAALVLGLSASHGWPSSHSALAAAFAAFETLEALSPSAPGVPTPLRAAELAAFWLLAALTAASRVAGGYHSAPQALAGAVVGVLVAACWWRAAGDGEGLRRAALGSWGGRALAWALAGEGRPRGAVGGRRAAAAAPTSASGTRRRAPR